MARMSMGDLAEWRQRYCARHSEEMVARVDEQTEDWVPELRDAARENALRLIDEAIAATTAKLQEHTARRMRHEDEPHHWT